MLLYTSSKRVWEVCLETHTCMVSVLELPGFPTTTAWIEWVTLRSDLLDDVINLQQGMRLMMQMIVTKRFSINACDGKTTPSKASPKGLRGTSIRQTIGLTWFIAMPSSMSSWSANRWWKRDRKAWNAPVCHTPRMYRT
jgi:hypothetical protein